MKAFLSSISLLTIIPVPQRWVGNISGASIYFGLTGLFIGLFYFGVAFLLEFWKINSLWSAFIILLFQIVFTRGLHLDGLADVCDGFWGGYDRARRLEIMKDSMVGSFGVISLVMLLLGKWIALNFLFEHDMVLFIVPAALISRWSLTLLSGIFQYSREKGTGHSVITNTGLKEVFLSASYTTPLLYFISGPGAIGVLFSAVSVSILIGILSLSKIRGITGDVLGANSEIIELFILAILPWFANNFPLWIRQSLTPQ